MRVPYSWLRDYVDVDLAPEALAERLTMAGLEVERVEYPWPGIVTAEIVWLERVQGSDHLSATRVTTGTEEFSVVCGASNIHVHDKAPLAKIGTKIGDNIIAEKKAMGVLSQGMLCSPRELGLSDDHAGIYILPPETPLGIPLGQLLGEAVIDLDIKAHRGDLSCVLGVAREVSAFTGKPLRPPEVTLREQGAPADTLMRLEVRDADLCPRYSARVVQGVTIGPSPRWMADRLIAAGMRPINNVVDVTNYVMLELGQPLHAFDYDKVAEHTIVVRRARPGEQLTMLDGVARTLTPEMLLITDPAGPVVIAGIFGGTRVEVADETTRVLLEAAHFAPASVRRTSQALALRTESSGRFEKNPDITLTAVAIDRAAQLLAQLAGGTVAPGRVDFYPAPVRPRELTFALGQVEWLTGMTVTAGEAVAALRGLGFGVEETPAKGKHAALRLTVPTWRPDVEESADVVEEIVRILGYDRIPSTIPTGPLPAPATDVWFEREDHLRELLLGAGLNEVMAYPLTSRPAMARLLPTGTPEEWGYLVAPAAERLPAITVHNAASSEMDTLRLTLMSGLLDVLRENAKHEDAGLWFFELGRRYLPAGTAGEADERPTLGAALCGPLARGWLGEARDADFFDLKGVAELLLGALKVESYRFRATHHPSLHPGRAAELEVRAVSSDSGEGDDVWVAVGVLGEVHPEVAERFDLSGRVCLMELDLERLYRGVPEMTFYEPIARVPAAQRDLAIVVAQETPAADLAAEIQASGGALVRGVRLFDYYTGQGIPAGKKSLAYTITYQEQGRTLTEAEIEHTHAGIVAALARRFGAELRS